MLTQQKIEQLLRHSLPIVDAERKKVLNKINTYRLSYILIGLVLVVLIFYFYLIGLNSRIGDIHLEYNVAAIRYGIMGLLMASALSLGVGFLLRKNYLKFTLPLRLDFELRVKKEAYAQIFKTWNDGLKYVPEIIVDHDLIRHSKFFRSDSRLYGDDYCHGTLEDGRPFRFSELKVHQIEEIRGETETAYAEKEVFRGLFFVLERTHSIINEDHYIVIKPLDQTNNYKIQKRLPKPKKERLSAKHNINILDADLAPIAEPPKEEDQEEEVPLFDQLYEVKSDHVDARQLLSDDFCNQLNHLRVQLNQPIWIGFNGNKVYMGVPHQTEFWVVNANYSLLDLERLRYTAWNFATAFQALERLAKMTQREGPRV